MQATTRSRPSTRSSRRSWSSAAFPSKNLEDGKVETAAGQSVRQKITLKQGVNSDSAKIVAMIKESEVKAQASIQGDTVRVVSKDKDTLQQIMGKLRAGDFGVALQFTNYRG